MQRAAAAAAVVLQSQAAAAVGRRPAVVEALSASASMKVAVTNVWSPLAPELPGVLPHLGQVAAEVAYQAALPQLAMVGVLS